MNQVTYTFITPVWGKSYLSIFLDICLPSILSTNNLPYLAKNSEVSFLLYINRNEEELIKSHEIIQKLSTYAQVEYRYVKFFPGRATHTTLSDCHRDGIKESGSKGTYAILLPPDTVWSDNSFYTLHNLVLKGIKAIHVVCLRLELEKIYPVLRKLVTNDGLLPLPPAKLVEASMENLHYITKQHFYNESNSNYGLLPSNFVWKLDIGLLAHCFHQHPILIKPNDKSINFKGTIDDDLFVDRAYAENEVHVVTDSDDMLAYEISSSSHNIGSIFEKGDIKSIADWAVYGANAIHRELVRIPMVLHFKPFKREEHSSILEEANENVNAILNQIKIAEIRNHLQARNVPSNLKSFKKSFFTYGNKSFKIDDLILGASLNLRRTHWMYLIQNKIFKPIAAQINSYSGCKFIIDDYKRTMYAYLSSARKEENNFYTTTDALYKIDNNLSKEKIFDAIYFIANSSKENTEGIIDIVLPYLKDDGKMTIYAYDDLNVSLGEIKDKISIINIKDFCNLGLGARLAYKLYNDFFYKFSSGMHHSANRVYCSITRNNKNNIFSFTLSSLSKITTMFIKLICYPILAIALIALEA